MTEEKQEAVETEATETQEPKAQSFDVDDKAVRNHPLFKKVTAQQKEELKAVKARVADFEVAHKAQEQAMEAAKAAEEGRLKEHYEGQLATLRAQIEGFDIERSRMAVESELRLAASNKGIVSTIVQRGLLAEYLALPEEKRAEQTPVAWVESLASSDEHASLFTGVKVPIGAGVSGRATSRGINTKALSERLLDPSDVEAFAEARRIVESGGTIE